MMKNSTCGVWTLKK